VDYIKVQNIMMRNLSRQGANRRCSGSTTARIWNEGWANLSHTIGL